MLQREMIEKVKSLATGDDNVSSVLMYGSFVKGEGDKYSDIEFYVFYDDDFEHEQWVNKVHKSLIFFTNEFGTEVAVFDNLIRGEFHFLPVTEMDVIQLWEGLTTFEYYREMILVDKEGKLAAILKPISKERPQHNTPDTVDRISKAILSSMIMINGLLHRGEYIHAQHNFHLVQKYILWLVRLTTQSQKHWEGPSKKAEEDIPREWIEQYKMCVPTAEKSSLLQAYNKMLRLSGKLFEELNATKEVKQLHKRLSPFYML